MDSDFKAGNFPVDEPNPRFSTGKGFVVPKAAPAFAEMSLSFTSLDKVLESRIELRCVAIRSGCLSPELGSAPGTRLRAHALTNSSCWWRRGTRARDAARCAFQLV